ncbi:hydrolase [Lithospermum erythrorhizon]|uniref:Hydrolase n=1 Tax=Lithospermum erythrorhizon TaxID=34254 RepID=A0AAV3PFJ5_LITER
MPLFDVSACQSGADAAANNGINIFYTTYGHGHVKVLMIIGLAGTHDSWGPQIKGLTGTLTPNSDMLPDGGNNFEEDGVEVCAFDNRGVGQSSVPTKKSQYTTSIMAKDAIALMDHLGWRKAHVFGHSMGGMIACKLAALVPDRILSLALLNVTGGGYECLPKLDRVTLSIAFRFLRAKTPEQRAAVDLDTHYSKEYLEEYVENQKRREILYQEYVRGISSTGMQSSYGFDGQLNACWTHKLTQIDIESICSAGFLISVIHGRHDVIAQLCHAKRLAEKLHPCARMVELPGGHLVSHERTEEVNKALLGLLKASEQNLSPCEWTNLPAKSAGSGWKVTWISLSRPVLEGRSNLYFRAQIFEKLYIFLMYIVGLFLLAFDYLAIIVRRLKPVKVVPDVTEQKLVDTVSTGSSVYTMTNEQHICMSSN